MKAVSDVIAPLSGEIVAVNDTLAEEPEKFNHDPLRRGLAGADPAQRPCRAR